MDRFVNLQDIQELSRSAKAYFCSDLEGVKTVLLTLSGIYLVMTVVQTFKPNAAPYGKFSNPSMKPKYQLPARLGWCLQEVPAFIMAFLAILKGMERGEKEHVLLLVPFTVHYFNRSFIFPLTIKEGRAVPLLTVVMAFVFCLVNGFMQSLFVLSGNLLFSNTITVYIGGWVFVSGMFINIQSDRILSSLRRPGETGYKIPYGGVFQYVSSPNYLGEILEWWGWFLMCPNPASLWFALFSSTFLGSRAIKTHAFYKDKFREEYPSDRTAIVPMLI